MSQPCQVIDRPAQPALAIRTRTSIQKLPQLVGQVFGSIGGYLGRLGEKPAGPPYAAYHNMDMQNLDVEIGFPVARALAGSGEIQPSQLPGGPAVAYLHIGPYDKISQAYEALTQWLQANGRQGTGVAYEVYFNSPAETAPEALQTQVFFPLR